jgi:ADP-dependent NAD(P)H-hydrate dehydratase / NAD(P)H-hydrate epimerase
MELLMSKILTVEEMRSVEKQADAAGYSYAHMMEQAGQSVARWIERVSGSVHGTRAVVMCGVGNNGGDGLVTAYRLSQAGAQVRVFLLKARPAGDENASRLAKAGVEMLVLREEPAYKDLERALRAADLVIDALLGTGTRLPLKDPLPSLLARANAALTSAAHRPMMVAVDCPSGVDCDSGQADAHTMRADLTVTLAAAKTGLLQFPAAEFTGRLVVGDIGLPTDFAPLERALLHVADASLVGPWLPARPRSAHKGTFGRVVVVAGSVNYPGAAVLSAEAAYRVGAGLVTLATPAAVQGFLVPRLPEATWLILPDETGVLSEQASEVLAREMGEAQAMIVGPGIGSERTTGAFMRRLLGVEDGGHPTRIGFDANSHTSTTARAWPPMVVDADGLRHLAKVDAWWTHLPAGSVITPHPGEMAALTGKTIENVQQDRTGLARRSAHDWGVVVVLKGAFTVVASPDGQMGVLPFATAALAHAGSGDVLSGAIAGLMAQGAPAWRAAVLGAYLHGRAGELAEEELQTSAAVLASDITQCLGTAIAELGTPVPLT